MKITYDGDVALISLPSKLDTTTSTQMEVDILKVVNDGYKKILCNFSRTEYISSFGLRALLSIAKKVQRTGGQLALSSMQPFVYEVFKITAFDRIFKIYKTKEDALKELL